MKQRNLNYGRLGKNREACALAFVCGYLKFLETRFGADARQNAINILDHLGEYFPELFDDKPYE